MAGVIPASNVPVVSVRLVDPETSFGCSVTCPPAGTLIVSGFRSHSATGFFAGLPVITSSVALYGGNDIVEGMACAAPATIVLGAPRETAYLVISQAVK